MFYCVLCICCLVFLTSVRVRGTVANPSNHSLRVKLEFIVDTGAIYTVIPKSVAHKLRLRETRLNQISF
jgi:predicted aspartyl protease